MKVATLSGIGLLAAALVLVLAVLPASAGSGLPSMAGVQPDEIEYGGGSGACGFIGSTLDELHINNPATGVYTTDDGATAVELFVSGGDKIFEYKFVDPGTLQPDLTYAAFDIIVNGGQKNTHYDNDGDLRPLSADKDLHAPTKGNSQTNLYKLSHINICYDINPFADLSITKTPLNEGEPVPPTSDFFANVGDHVTFEITVTNSTDSTVEATGVTVRDELPDGMEFVSASTPGDETESGSGIVVWDDLSIPNTAPANELTLTLVVRITAAAAGNPAVINSATAVGDQFDPNTDPDNPGVNNAVSVPAVTVTADVSGTKFHDRDTDGGRDATREEGLGGWTIAAFDTVTGELKGTATTTTTDEPDDPLAGTYTIAGLEPGTYTICEATETVGLPDPPSGTGYAWAWAQSTPANTLCGAYVSLGYEPAGYSRTIDAISGDISGIDFGNYTEVTFLCEDGATGVIEVILGGDGTADNPLSTVKVPRDCASGEFTTAFDVGRSDRDDPDEDDDYTQFVVFGGIVGPDPVLIEQTILWDAEQAVYDPATGSLVVPTSQVVLIPGPNAQPQPVVFCSTLGGLPTVQSPHCLDYRTIAENGPDPLMAGEIQLTEYYKFLGDPGTFR